jgi:hypothetical protein
MILGGSNEKSVEITEKGDLWFSLFTRHYFEYKRKQIEMGGARSTNG